MRLQTFDELSSDVFDAASTGTHHGRSADSVPPSQLAFLELGRGHVEEYREDRPALVESVDDFLGGLL